MNELAFLLVITLCLIGTEGSRSYTCIRELYTCECLENQVNCTGSGLTQLPSEMTLDLGVTYFYFQRNNLTEIKATHFQNLLDMTYLSLRKNQIKNVEGKSLDSNTKLETIDFSYNRITFIPVHLFIKLVKLSRVYLDHNKLTRLESSHFIHMTQLVDLRLEDNELTYIGKEAFVNSPKLHQLYLEKNKLEIPEEQWFAVFNNHEEGYEVFLDDNEWSCDCRMKNFYKWGTNHEWFMHHDGEGVSVPQCHFPDRLRGTNLARIDSVDELTCTKVSITSQNGEQKIKTVEGQPIKIDCEATGFPLPEVTIANKEGKTLTSSKGTTSYQLDSVSTSDSGLYTCTATGYDENGKQMSVLMETEMTVYRSPGSVAATVIISLFVVLVILAVGVWYYRTKLGKQSLYGRLPNDAVYYERENVSSAATYNAESIRSPAGGGPPAPTHVENPYRDETDSTEEENIEYNKDSEFLV